MTLERNAMKKLSMFNCCLIAQIAINASDNVCLKGFYNPLKAQHGFITKTPYAYQQRFHISVKIFRISPPGTDPSFCFIALLCYINMIVHTKSFINVKLDA